LYRQMANDNNIHHFTATDIERYHRGQLSAKQMHDLEKAALDDPFLADALEGYAVAGVNGAADIADLKNRLAEKMEGAKVISLQTAPRNSYRSLRAAVMILFIAGAGILVYQLGFNKKENGIASAEPTKKETPKNSIVTDSTAPTGTITQPATEENKNIAKQGPGEKTDPVVENDIKKDNSPTKPGTDIGAGEVTTVTDNVNREKPATTNANPDSKVVMSPVKTADDEATKKLAERNDNKTAKEGGRQEDYFNETKGAVSTTKDKALQQDRNANAAMRKSEGYVNNTNTFRGRVTDADNNGVPFANVTNVQDNNAGTYTDARGYFNLTYPDSVLHVQVRSIGFENNNVQLRNSVPNNQVIMQDDRKSLSEVVLSNQRSNTNAATTRSRDANMKLEEPEPVDGWVYYDAYLANNIEVPDDLKSKRADKVEVQVSFAVDKNGEPTDVRVEKSDCTQCNKEAIRLVKEGPKFKRTANRKGRTTVTVSF
jgi:hypothetical protein